MHFVKRLTTLHFAVLDLFLTGLSLALADKIRPFIPLGVDVPAGYSFLSLKIFLLVGIIWTISFLLLKVYSFQYSENFLFSTGLILAGVAVSSFVLACSFYLFKIDGFSRLVFLYFVVLNCLLLVLYRILVKLTFPKILDFNPGRVAVLGSGPVGTLLAQRLQNELPLEAQLVGFISDRSQKENNENSLRFLGNISNLEKILKRFKITGLYVMLSPETDQAIVPVVLKLQNSGLKIKLKLMPVELLMARDNSSPAREIPLLKLGEGGIPVYALVIKRALDLFLASLLLIVSLPLFLLIGAIIKLNSPGPVLFTQLRVGENARVFQMFKFRTMYRTSYQPGSENNKKPLPRRKRPKIIHKIPEDPRVTPIGRFLRRTSLDELPQLLNVLTGTMSLVGPRPELPQIVENYRPWQFSRFTVLPGMTGWWQVNGRSENPMHLSTEFDLYYIKNYSLLLDLKIIARTPLTIISGRGAF